MMPAIVWIFFLVLGCWLAFFFLLPIYLVFGSCYVISMVGDIGFGSYNRAKMQFICRYFVWFLLFASCRLLFLEMHLRPSAFYLPLFSL